MNKFVQFLKDSYAEMTENVSWSTFKELQQSSVLVLVASLIFAIVIGLVDAGFNKVLEVVYDATF